MLTQKNKDKVQIKYDKGIAKYNRFINSITNNTIDKIVMSKSIMNKDMDKINSLIKQFTFKDIKDSYIFEGGVLLFPNADLFITKLNSTEIQYVVRQYNHYETMSFIISKSKPHNVTITKTRLRHFTISRLQKFIWHFKQKGKLKNILTYLSKTKD